MKNLWSQKEADQFTEKYSGLHGDAVALRVYSSRLIGSEPALVMHGGGNTSVKGSWTDLAGQVKEAIFVKGSGWDLDTIEPEGLPGLDLEYLRKLRALEELSDEEMVNELRTHLFLASSPTPSVETLLHAFLPYKYVDHSHAEAVLSITNRANGEELVRRVFGNRVAVVPYVMPGFSLARAVADMHDKAVEEGQSLEGLVLMKHGLFTFGETAESSYSRHIGLVTEAEEFIASEGDIRIKAPEVTGESIRRSRAARIAPLIRRALHELEEGGRMILEYHGEESQINFVDAGTQAEKEAMAGPMTPDHVIRTKPLPLWMEVGGWDDDDALWKSVRLAVSAYSKDYLAYFEKYGPGRGRKGLTRLDPMPRVILVPGCGLFAAGRTVKDASIAADLYRQTIRMKVASSALGRYEGLPAGDLFDMEYWSLEQAKLGKKKPMPLAGRVALIAGGGGPIGSGIAEALSAEGATVVLGDISESAMTRTLERVKAQGGEAIGIVMDVTDPEAIEGALDEICLRYGGLDQLVINAGVAHVQSIPEMDLEAFRKVTEVNLFGAMNLLKLVSTRLIRQAIGGDIILVSSKNVTAPGADFGAYSASKAGAHQLMRVGALELAGHDIRVNAVLPDAVFGDEETPSGLWQEVGPARARSRGMEESELQEFYRRRNLLKSKVTGLDVGRAVAFFARRDAPVTGAALPVDGGVAAAFPR